MKHADSITAGPDGNLWFTETLAHKIGRLEPTIGKITEFPASHVTSSTSLTLGPDGNLWFNEPSSNTIGRLTPDGSQITELPVPSPNADLLGITAGPDGNLWFVEEDYRVNHIARINPSNFSVREFQIPTSGSRPQQREPPRISA